MKYILWNIFHLLLQPRMLERAKLSNILVATNSLFANPVDAITRFSSNTHPSQSSNRIQNHIYVHEKLSRCTSTKKSRLWSSLLWQGHLLSRQRAAASQSWPIWRYISWSEWLPHGKIVLVCCGTYLQNTGISMDRCCADCFIRRRSQS